MTGLILAHSDEDISTISGDWNSVLWGPLQIADELQSFKSNHDSLMATSLILEEIVNFLFWLSVFIYTSVRSKPQGNPLAWFSGIVEPERKRSLKESTFSFSRELCGLSQWPKCLESCLFRQSGWDQFYSHSFDQWICTLQISHFICLFNFELYLPADGVIFSHTPPPKKNILFLLDYLHHGSSSNSLSSNCLWKFNARKKNSSTIFVFCWVFLFLWLSFIRREKKQEFKVLWPAHQSVSLEWSSMALRNCCVYLKDFPNEMQLTFSPSFLLSASHRPFCISIRQCASSSSFGEISPILGVGWLGCLMPGLSS